MSDIGKTIDSVLASDLAPFLKSRGFKKSARTFYRTDAESVAVINVQASQWNQGTEGRFTINVGRYFPSVAAVQDKQISGAVPKEYECTVRARIGIIRDNHDHWWQIDSATDCSELAKDVRAQTELYAFPWLDQRATLAQLKERSDQLMPRVAESVALACGESV